ncbi:MAG: SDR family oxidoreductase [Myxococcales bacterium]|nr:SDR family oxidoreductase [Myxococcales bacterium]HIK84965.1 SDR family oxidoreductase [Myxococcales bacterium]
MEIHGRKAIILGGTSGIGLEAARQLVDGGAEVVAASRSDANRDTASRTLGPNAVIREVDVLDREGLAALFTEQAPFDILVCAATGGPRALGPFLEMELDGFRGSFAKLWGYTNAVRLGTKLMSDDGTIVLVSGYPARRPSPGASAISTVGNAVEGFARAIASEIAPRRINVVSPGVISTPMFNLEPELRDTFLASATESFAIPRAGQSEEVASAIMFLIQNEYVTGTTVDVDGGALLS